jgi:hypothetical protein
VPGTEIFNAGPGTSYKIPKTVTDGRVDSSNIKTGTDGIIGISTLYGDDCKTTENVAIE